MQRYFVDIDNSIPSFTSDDVFHIVKVMRFKSGDNIEVVDNSTHQVYLARIKGVNPLSVEIVEPIIKDNELPQDVTLFFALAKSDKIEFVIQKATELGAKKVVLFQGKRSVVRFSNDDFDRKKMRYLSIAKEASEQCHREFIPEIEYCESIKNIKPHLCDINLLAYELSAGKTTSLGDELEKACGKSISVIIGPEGGFDESEVNLLQTLDFKLVSLGKRILRCETAAVYALSVIAFNLEK